MTSGARRKKQRSTRVRLKADCVVLLDRIIARHADLMTDREVREITEMRMRMDPPVGVTAPIVLTGYTKS
jgi:hypothetical protein